MRPAYGTWLARQRESENHHRPWSHLDNKVDNLNTIMSGWQGQGKSLETIPATQQQCLEQSNVSKKVGNLQNYEELLQNSQRQMDLGENGKQSDNGE